MEDHLRTGCLPNPRGCKYTVNATMMVFDTPGMARPVCMRDLKELIFTSLSKLIDKQVQRALAGSSIIQAINVFMLKIINNNFG